jgi:hypothetical protein
MVRSSPLLNAANERKATMPADPKKPKAAAAPPITGGNATVTIINQALALLVQANTMIQPILRGPFTAREKLAMVKARRAVTIMAPTMIEEAIEKPNLAPNNTTAAELQDQLDTVAAFQTFSNKLAGFSKQAGGTALSLQSDVTKMALDIYAIAERNTADSSVQELVAQMKTALANGPRFPRKKVTTLPKPVTMHVPAEAAAAAQAAVEAQQQVASNSTGSSTPATPATPGTPTAPQVPVYAPGGQVGTAPATNGK